MEEEQQRYRKGEYTKQTSRTEPTEHSRSLGPNCCCALPSRESVPTPQLPPSEPSMTAHGMEYPALFGQEGSARLAVPLFWIPVNINPVLAKPRTLVITES